MNTVVILGAGVAGMSAARVLIENGIKPLILERKAIPGGRAFSFLDEKSGEIINNGEHVMIGAYKSFFKLLKFIGSYDELESQKALKTIYYDKNQTKYVFDTGLAPGNIGKALGLLRFKALTFQEKVKAVVFINKIKSLKIQSKNKTAFEILLENNQSHNLINKLWEPVILATMNASPAVADAGLFLEVIDVIFNGNSFSSKIFFPKTNLSALFSRFEENISRLGAEIKFNSNIIEIIKVDDKPYELVLQGGEIIYADKIISTLPPFVLKKLYVQALPGNFIDKLEYSTIISAYLWYDKEINSEKFIGLLDSETHWLFRRREANQSYIFPERIATTISAAKQIENKSRYEIITLLDSEIKRNLPEAQNAKLLNSKLLIDKRATPLFTPDINYLRPNSNLNDNFYLAGDWTNTGLPATLEGAALSGEIAVNNLLNDYRK